MGSLNLDEGRAMGVTMLLAHSVWGIVAPEISAPRFRQGLQGKDGVTGSGLSGGSVTLVALRSHLSSRHGGMASGSRCRRSWIMASTSCSGRRSFHSNMSTKAAGFTVPPLCCPAG